MKRKICRIISCILVFILILAQYAYAEEPKRTTNDKCDVMFLGFTFTDEYFKNDHSLAGTISEKPVITDFGLITDENDIDENSIDSLENKSEFFSAFDLSIYKLESTSNLVAYEDSTFEYQIQFNGTGKAYNFEMDIEIDGNKKNSIQFASLGKSQYGYFTIRNMREGEHTIKLTIDSANILTSETDKNNNTYEKTFTWTVKPNSLPDLTAKIESPKQSKNLKGNDKNIIEFSIMNMGYAPVTEPFYFALEGNGEELQRFKIPNMPSRYTMYGTFLLKMEDDYGEVELKINPDSTNVIKESNENNNTWTNTYYIHKNEFPSKEDILVKYPTLNILNKIKSLIKTDGGF